MEEEHEVLGVQLIKVENENNLLFSDGCDDVNKYSEASFIQESIKIELCDESTDTYKTENDPLAFRDGENERIYNNEINMICIREESVLEEDVKVENKITDNNEYKTENDPLSFRDEENEIIYNNEINTVYIKEEPVLEEDGKVKEEITYINEYSDLEDTKGTKDNNKVCTDVYSDVASMRETKEKKRKRNQEYQRKWRQRQKALKKKVSKEEKEEEKRKRHCKNQRAYYYRQKNLKENDKNVEELSQKKLDDLQMKRKKLDGKEYQENVVQCRASQNLENVQLEKNQFFTQKLCICEESHECITPKVILHKNTNVPGDANCLFHSLIYVLQLQILTCDLRKQLCDSPYLNSCYNPQAAYNKLSSNNEYGDLDCVYLFAKTYNQNICVHYHYFNIILKNDDIRFCHFKVNDTHNWIHLDLHELHFTPYISDDEKKKEDERKRKQKNKEYSKRYHDKKRTSNLQTGPSAKDVLDVQPVIHTSKIADQSTRGVPHIPPVTCSSQIADSSSKQKQKNKEYSKRYRDKKRTSNLQTGQSARDVLDIQPVIHRSQIAGPSSTDVPHIPSVICSSQLTDLYSKQKQKNKEYSKQYRDKKRTSKLQTDPSARDVLHVQPVIYTSQIP